MGGLRARWDGDGGYREVLKIAGPLVLSMGSWSLMHFIDRMFLTWYSPEALAASMPASLLSFACGSFFVGTAGYVNTFVAQYYGAKRYGRVGAALWQGIYFSLISGLLILGLVPLAKPIFDLVAHDPSVRDMEVVYFQILTAWIWAVFLMSALSSFFSGRGETWTVMWVNIVGVVINIALDYVWIFGYAGFPRWGIRGAAWATALSQVFGCVLFFILMLRKPFRERYHTLKAWRFDRVLFRRLLRYGSPNGFQLMVELMGFSAFVLLVGRIGMVELAATNLAFNINTLAFVPMLGVGIAVSTLVGQYLGDNRPEPAEKSAWSACHLSLAYMLVMALSFVLIPNVFMAPFEQGADMESFVPVRDMATVLLRFVAFYCVFDAIYIVFSAAIKGAGDMRFVMWSIILMSIGLLGIPTYLVISVANGGVFASWVVVAVYIVSMSLIFFWRFRGGKWKSMRVIETETASPVEPS